MSTQLPSSASEIASVAEAAGQLGIQTDNILDFTKAMIDLGNSTNLTSDEAASQLAKFANIMQMSQEDFDKLGSSIVDLGNHFATTEADIVEMAMRLAGAGKQVGLSEGEVLGLATALSSVGIEAEMGGSAISKAMVKMQNAVEQGGTKLNDVLKKTGLTLRELELMSANDSKGFKELSQSIGMTSTEVKQLVTAGANLEDFAKISGMTTEQFKKAWKEDAAGALSEFIKGLGDAENKGESAITMLSEMGLTEVRLRDSLLRAANAGTLFNDAIETGNKAWKDNTALVNEANKRYATNESQMKMLKNEVQKTAIEFGEELAPSLRDIVNNAKPMLKSISSSVKAFSELNDEQKQTILKIGAVVVALGPATKILGTTVKALGTAKKTIGTVTGAVGLLKNGTKDATGASADLANGLKKIVSPAGLATIAITGLAAATVYFRTHETEAQKEIREFAGEMSSAKKSLEDYNKSINDTANANIAHINSSAKLRDELSLLVDENGKVEEKNKGRVSFILNELNSALGTEYELNGNIIEGYKELQSEIEKTIEKKKAEIILNAEEEKYKNAIENQKQAIEDLRKAKEELGGSSIEALKVELSALEKMRYGNSQQANEIRNKINAYNDAEYRVKTYTENVKSYESDYEQFVAGNYDAINNKITTTTQEWCDKSLSDIRKSIKEKSKELDEYKEIYKQYGNDIAKQHSEQADKDLDALITELQNRTSTINDLGQDEIMAWQTVAVYSYDKYFDVLSNMDPTLAQKIQDMTGVILEEKPELIEETQIMAQEMLDAMNNSSEFKKEALSSLNSYLQGLKDDELRNLLEASGTENVEKVLQGIRQGNLGEDEGMKILNSLNTGLQNKSWKDTLFKTARGIASSLSSLLSVNTKITTNSSTNSSTGHADGLAYVPYNNYPARLHEGERVLTKEQNKHYMADNIETKMTSRNIVVQFYPQTMNETELQRAERYIARKWGAAL